MPLVALRVQTSTTQLTLPGDRKVVVGRASDSDIVVSHPKVSRRHVALEPSPDGWTASDLSANGLWHDGQRVTSVPVGTQPTRLRLGAVDGPELTLTAIVPVDVPPAAPAEPDVDEAETRLAPASGPLARPGRVAAPAAQPAPTPSTPVVTRRRPPRWLSTVPTLIWLFAAAFALGALVTLS
ncbi:FHA domain-containing protein [Frankia sp. AgB1.9]|uniref:FHA domain-containing protein n=1 Tax=unclassified Frankia TaxID=2632575 RepID=UPI00193169EF|nr:MULTISPECIES: FHA domain-containing protein [unclassified Frankia]MBL7487247.1 FHA domain-containing protein [Frankia sp. AgW1.1]MBL7547393.1 FHA domain-containing protein [Frankia sp. AgB1.9]MBL7618701.1 FHA domain-containing protein [Frankia sp. AgB1.8]